MFKLKVIIIFSAVSFLLLSRFLADNSFNKAVRYQEQYRWEKAEENFKSAIKYAPFNSEYLAGYGEFLFRISPYQKDKDRYLKMALGLYEKAEKLNPSWAEYPLRIGEIQVNNAIWLLSENKTAAIEDLGISRIFMNFKKAYNLDPKGFNVSYAIGYMPLKLWKYLDEGQKKFVMDRLKATIKANSSYSGIIYEELFRQNNNNINDLMDVAGDNLDANWGLYNFIAKRNMWEYRKDLYGKIKKLDHDSDPRKYFILSKEKEAYYAQVRKQSKEDKAPKWYAKLETGEIPSYLIDGDQFITGTLDTIINIPENKSMIKVIARGEKHDNVWPYCVFLINNDEAAEGYIDSSQWKDFSFVVSHKPGESIFTVTCLNSGTKNRKLFIKEVIVEPYREE